MTLQKMNERETTKMPRADEAIKLVADWSKWLVGIQTGLIALISFANIGKTNYLWVRNLGIVFFIFSILSAMFVLYALPGMLQRADTFASQNLDCDILMMGTLNGKGIPLYIFTQVESLTFGVGVICLIVYALNNLP